MRNVWLVVRREYLQRVRSRWFVFATLAGPLLLAAVILVPAWMAGGGETERPRIAVQDRTGLLFEEVAERLREGGMIVGPAGASETESRRLVEELARGALTGYLVLDEETLRSGRASWFGQEALPPLRALSLRQAVVTSALTVQLREQGMDPGALLAGGSLEATVVGTGAAATGERALMVGFIGGFLLYMVILLYAVSVMRATLQEKTDRLVEVILSAMEPWHLMLGKILGVGAVGLTQVAVWVAFGAVAATAGLPRLASRPGFQEMDAWSTALPGGRLLAVFVGLFLGGYFLYSSLYAAVGAMCSSDDEAQQAQFPVMLLLLVPMVLITPVLDQPGSAFSSAVSLVPFFTPILMWPRVVAGAVPGWELALGFVLMAAAVVVVARVAGRVYKVGVLMTGKRPTLPELWRWVREA